MNRYVSKNRAFHKCISRARNCSPDEAAEYYRLAVMIDPVAEEGYLGLLDCLKEGGVSFGEECLLKDALCAAEYDRSIKNIDNLKINEEGYKRVIREIGRYDRTLAEEI